MLVLSSKTVKNIEKYEDPAGDGNMTIFFLGSKVSNVILRNTKTPQGTETDVASNIGMFFCIEKYEDPAGDGNSIWLIAY